TDFATLRGTGSVTDAEAGLLEYITLACVDQSARAGRAAGANGAPAARSLALGEFLRAQGITEWVGRAKATAAVLNVRVAGRGGLARLYLPGWEPADLTTASGWEPATAAAPDLAALVQTRLALPTVRLPASAGALRPGDVVLLGATDVTAVAGCRLVTSQGWSLAQVTVERDSADVVTVRCGALAPALWDAAAAAPGDPVLGPTIGSQFLSLEQIARWPVGAPLDLPKETHAAVDLWRGGRIVARGELVRVDGELGVRVTEVSVDALATG
ncbi:MAG: FliM/FliN family flagellar motor switch protein, partial [Phycisphaerae bacterium]